MHTLTFVFKDFGSMDKLMAPMIAYPNMDDIMWAREQYDEHSNMFIISAEDKPALVAIKEARKRV